MANLKTHPGGHRGLRRFDPRIKALWRLLHETNPMNEHKPHERTVKLDELTALLGVSRSTVHRWLAFLARHKLIALRRRQGGRGRGILIELTWAKRGEQMAEQRARLLAKKAQQVSKSGETISQGIKSLPPTGDSTNRARLMAQARMALTVRIHDPAVATQAINACGRWLWKEKPGSEEFQRFFRGISQEQRIPVPRWVHTAQDVHRWIRGLIAQLLRYGAAWWARLHQGVKRHRLKRTLGKLQLAVVTGRSCPICQRFHDRCDWREGRTRGQLNCIGWARVKLDELQLQPVMHRVRQETNQALRRRWVEEREQYKTPLWWYLERPGVPIDR